MKERLLPAEDPRWLRRTLIAATLAALSLLLLLPLALVFTEALRRGVHTFIDALTEPAALHAVKLTLITAAIVVPLNTVFGFAAAWLVTRHRFRGQGLLVSLIDLPFAVSPVIAGLALVLLFGAGSLFGSWLHEWGIRIIFALPGIVLATCFITFPFVARELIPLMESRGDDEEAAALSLGAGGWRTFFRVTLPNVKWALFYGVILCNARAMGEFGAVSVVSGHIREQTNTLPLHIEILYNEYQFAAAFAASTLLAVLALITLVVKTLLERRFHRRRTAH